MAQERIKERLKKGRKKKDSIGRVDRIGRIERWRKKRKGFRAGKRGRK